MKLILTIFLLLLAVHSYSQEDSLLDRKTILERKFRMQNEGRHMQRILPENDAVIYLRNGIKGDSMAITEQNLGCHDGYRPLKTQVSENDAIRYNTDATHRFKTSQLIAPVICIGVGIFGVGNDWFENQSRDLRNELQENIDKRITVDDYSQYAPSVSVYALNLFGVKGKHDFKDRTMILAMSWLTMAAISTSLKYIYGERRPDGSTRNSFPSGHTATAFMGAEFLYQEYKDVSPWIGIAGYTVAACTGFFRMYNNRHWLNDVIAGAGIGMLSTKLSYWLYPKLFKKSVCANNGRKAHLMAVPYYADRKIGCSGAIFF